MLFRVLALKKIISQMQENISTLNANVHFMSFTLETLEEEINGKNNEKNIDKENEYLKEAD